ncbi:hypothetical protein A0130_07975 [Leifsonia xyli]|uniref:hypothetical protein n=1 Tax=Leifsonia xyli TaxID=1575 RepID=UPI0007CDD75E|nr:hypothetical protein A0130_07975 [Leifsonia xyli]
MIVIFSVLGVGLLFMVALAARPWWDSTLGLGFKETITNDTGHTITWGCTGGDQTMLPGETKAVTFIGSANEFDGCNYADQTQMCLDEYRPAPEQRVKASYAIKEWACR